MPHQKRVSGCSGILPQEDTAEDATPHGHAQKKNILLYSFLQYSINLNPSLSSPNALYRSACTASSCQSKSPLNLSPVHILLHILQHPIQFQIFSSQLIFHLISNLNIRHHTPAINTANITKISRQCSITEQQLARRQGKAFQCQSRP